MAGSSELELKFALDDTTAGRLERAGYGRTQATRTMRLWSTYHDTPEGDLSSARVTLRVRRTPDGYVQTVKADGETPFDRFEHERPVPGPDPERSALPEPGTHAGDVLARHFDRVRPLFSTDFERITWEVQPTRALAVELSADTGEVRTGGPDLSASVPIRELELERLSGSRVAFLWWALRFATRFRLVLALPTKNERGLRLCGRLASVPEPVSASRAGIRPGQSIGEAAAITLRADLAHLIANIEPLLGGQDPEAVHQLRVALRRLRSTIRLFDLAEQDPRWTEVDRTARTLAAAAGDARDADVFDLGLLAKVRAALPDDRALSALATRVHSARDAARDRTRCAFRSHEASRFVLTALYLAERLAAHARPRRPGRAPVASEAPVSVSSVIEPGAPTAGPAVTTAAVMAPPTPASLDAPVAAFARERAAALWARLERRMRKARGPDGWHRARIAAKNLRYALDQLVPVLPRRARMRRASKRLAKLQQRLGEARDQAIGAALARRIADEARLPPGDAARAAALIEGWNAHGASTPSGDTASMRRQLRRLRNELKPLASLPAPPESP